MKFIDVIETFVKLQEDGKRGRTSETYKRKIYVFYEYVTTKLAAADVNYISILSAMSMEQILDSVEFYVKTYNIKYRATVDTYLTTISLFFVYISDSFGWKNKYFENNSKNKELRMEYENKIIELNLYRKSQTNPLSDDECELLIKACDEKINKVPIENIILGENNGVYSYFISSVITKLVLFSGIKNNVIIKLGLEQYDDLLNKLNINGFTVRLPDELAKQMKKYIKVRSMILLENENEDRLFININKENRNLDNSKMFCILKDITGCNKAMAVAKYSILQMIKKGVPSQLIMDFTGY